MGTAAFGWRSNLEIVMLEFHSTLYLYGSAIDEELDTRDVACIVGREEDRGLGDLVRLPQATQGHGRRKLSVKTLALFLGLREPCKSGSLNRSWADCVDANLAVLQIGGPATRK